MIEFKYDNQGNLKAFENGKEIGAVITMGDDISSENDTLEIVGGD